MNKGKSERCLQLTGWGGGRLKTLGSRLDMPKNLPSHCSCITYVLTLATTIISQESGFYVVLGLNDY